MIINQQHRADGDVTATSEEEPECPSNQHMTPSGRTDGDVTARAEEAQSNSLNNNNTDGDVVAIAEGQSASPINSDTGWTY